MVAFYANNKLVLSSSNMNISRSDLIVFVLYFCVGLPVTLADAWSPENSLSVIVGNALIYFVFTILATYLIAYVLLPRYLPNRNYIVLFPLIVLVLVVLGSTETILYRIIDLDTFSNLTAGKIFRNFLKPNLWLWGLISTTQNAGMLIALLMGKRFFDAQLTIQQREKEKKENELRLLKSQIDPHFLFNNLNTLDALIDTDTQRAKTYVNKLSQLYRYLISTKDDEVVSLEEELSFAKNYIYLLEQRFGNAYQFTIQKNTDIDKILIPPGVLQTLIENVVKHNFADHNNPIKTTIDITTESITVTNNLRKKDKVSDSYGIGLNNLLSRYRLLSDLPVKITEDIHYQVTLPTLLIV